MNCFVWEVHKSCIVNCNAGFSKPDSLEYMVRLPTLTIISIIVLVYGQISFACITKRLYL